MIGEVCLRALTSSASALASGSFQRRKLCRGHLSEKVGEGLLSGQHRRRPRHRSRLASARCEGRCKRLLGGVEVGARLRVLGQCRILEQVQSFCRGQHLGFAHLVESLRRSGLRAGRRGFLRQSVPELRRRRVSASVGPASRSASASSAVSSSARANSMSTLVVGALKLVSESLPGGQPCRLCRVDFRFGRPCCADRPAPAWLFALPLVPQLISAADGPALQVGQSGFGRG